MVRNHIRGKSLAESLYFLLQNDYLLSRSLVFNGILTNSWVWSLFDHIYWMRWRTFWPNWSRYYNLTTTSQITFHKTELYWLVVENPAETAPATEGEQSADGQPPAEGENTVKMCYRIFLLNGIFTHVNEFDSFVNFWSFLLNALNGIFRSNRNE